MEFMSVGFIFLLGIAGYYLGSSLSSFIDSKIKIGPVIKFLISIFTMVLLIACWTVLFKPILIDRPRALWQIENSWMEDKALKPYFSAIKEYDRSSYDEMIEEIFTYQKSPDAESNSWRLLGESRGAVLAKKYFKAASERVVRDYVDTYHRFIDSIVGENPLLICKLENPEIFGKIDGKDLEDPRLIHHFTGLKNIVRSAVLDKVDFDPSRAQRAYSRFIEDLKLKYPQHLEQLSQSEEIHNYEKIKGRAKALLDFYALLLSYTTEEVSDIYKLSKIN